MMNRRCAGSWGRSCTASPSPCCSGSPASFSRTPCSCPPPCTFWWEASHLRSFTPAPEDDLKNSVFYTSFLLLLLYATLSSPMNVPATLKHSFLLCLFAAAVPLRAIPAPMQVTAATPARVWTEGYGTGNGRLGILSFGVFPKETVVLNEGSIFAKKNFQMREGAAEALDKARELCKEGKYRSADQLFRKNILPPGNIAGDYQQGGRLQVEFQGLPSPSSYQRTLDMRRGKATTRAQFGTGELTTEILAAPSSDCAAYHIACTMPSGSMMNVPRCAKPSSSNTSNPIEIACDGSPIMVYSIFPIAGE